MSKITSKNLTISTADALTLPLLSFHVLILVEPDPEEWMPALDDEDSFKLILKMYNGLISDELMWWDNPEAPNNLPDFVSNRVIWVGHDALDFYRAASEFASVTFGYWGVEADFFTELGYYLQGLYAAHPEFRLAVVGAMVENEVMEVANLSSQIGFVTTILTRYCFSKDAFVNLDDLSAEVNEHRRILREMGLTEEDIWGLDEDEEDEEFE